MSCRLVMCQWFYLPLPVALALVRCPCSGTNFWRPVPGKDRVAATSLTGNYDCSLPGGEQRKCQDGRLGALPSAYWPSLCSQKTPKIIMSCFYVQTARGPENRSHLPQDTDDSMVLSELRSRLTDLPHYLYLLSTHYTTHWDHQERYLKPL